jgi:hypothetical protein
MSWKAAQCHGSARKEKGEARERKRTGSGRKREKKRKGERMRRIALWRIFDFALLHRAFCKSKLGKANLA